MLWGFWSRVHATEGCNAEELLSGMKASGPAGRSHRQRHRHVEPDTFEVTALGSADHRSLQDDASCHALILLCHPNPEEVITEMAGGATCSTFPKSRGASDPPSFPTPEVGRWADFWQ